MSKSEEMVDVVDLENQVLFTTTRGRVRQENLLHRGVGILVFNGQGQVYVHQRTASKDLFPSMFDMLVGGVVSSGEDYLLAAQREVREELGVENDELQFLFDHLYQGPKNNSWIRVYAVRWDGPVRHQPEEVAWGGWVLESDLESWAQTVPIVPDGQSVFQQYLEFRRQRPVVLIG